MFFIVCYVINLNCGGGIWCVVCFWICDLLWVVWLIDIELWCERILVEFVYFVRFERVDEECFCFVCECDVFGIGRLSWVVVENGFILG